MTWGVCPYKEELTTKEKNELLTKKHLLELVQNGDVSIFKIPILEKARQILQNELPPMVRNTFEVYWLYGKTGSGKSKFARDEIDKLIPEGANPSYYKWVLSARNQTSSCWFDGYNGQPYVILEEVRSSTIPFETMLRITDIYNDCKVPIKGGFVRWCPTKIYITSSGKPGEVYCRHGGNDERREFDGIEQLYRRITKCIEFSRKRGGYEKKEIELIWEEDPWENYVGTPEQD